VRGAAADRELRRLGEAAVSALLCSGIRRHSSSSHARAVHGEADLAPSLLPSRRAAPAPSAGEGGEAARRAAVPPPLPPPALIPPPPIPAAVAPASARAWAARSVDGADGRAWAACGLAAAAAPLLRLELVSPRPCPAAAPARRGGDSTPSPLSLGAGRHKLEQGRRRGGLRAAWRADRARARSHGTGGFPVELPPLASRGSRGGVASRGGRGGAASGADAARRPRRGGADAPRRGSRVVAGQPRPGGRGKDGASTEVNAMARRGGRGERERADGWVRFLQGQRRLFMWCGVLETKIKEWSVLCTISKSGVCCSQIHNLGMCHIPISLD